MIHFVMPSPGLSFGRTVYLWRQAKGLTQEALARKAELSRPNLSMIEQGGRDVTLDTARRIAEALGIRPGILADGVGPEEKQAKSLSRNNLDRITRFLAGERIRLSKTEERIARIVHPIAKQKLELQKPHSKALPRTARKEKQSWETLKASLRSEELNTLIKRIEKHVPSLS